MVKAIDECPALWFIDFTSPIYVQTDASDYGIGGFLFQLIDGIVRPIEFLSKTLSKAQRRWSTPDKEAYAIIYCLKRWDYLLRDVRFCLQTDHKNLTYLNFEGSAKVKRWKLFIQEYSFDIQYLPGPDNVVADGFSRLCSRVEDGESPVVGDGKQVDNFAFCLSHLFYLAVEPEEELAFEGGTQFNSLLSDDIDSSPFGLEEILAAHFELEDLDVLFTLSDALGSAIPEPIYSEIKAVHNALVGHNGVDRTLHRLREKKIVFKYQRALVKKFISECPWCQKSDERTVQMGVVPTTLSSIVAMQRLALDSIGPLPESEFGFKHILVVICTFTRWVMLYPTRTLEAVECARAMIQHFGIFGVPAVVCTDGGSQLENKLVNEVLELVSVRHSLSIPYSSEENGIVERVNKEVMRYIRALVFDERSPTKWPDYVPFAQRICNAEVVSSMGHRPAQLIFGNAINLDRSILLPNKVSDHDHSNKSEYVRNLIIYQTYAMEAARKAQMKTDFEHVVQRGASVVTEFRVGSYVTLEYPEASVPRAPTKLVARRAGPFQVHSSSGADYEIRDLQSDKLSRVHIKRLRAFVFDETRVDPASIVAADRSEFLVETVLEHSPTLNVTRRRSELVFKIRWMGYGPEHDSWEPWSELRANDIVHAYMRAHGMGSIISPLYRVPGIHP